MVATPWDSAIATIKPLAAALAGKVVVSMANALAKQGREFLALVPPTGLGGRRRPGRAARLAGLGLLPPPAGLRDGEARPPRWWPTSWSAPTTGRATEATVALVDRIEGLRGVDAGSLAQAAPIEAFTAVLITINIRHKVHAAVQLAGYGPH